MTETKQAPVEPTNAELAARLKELVRATAEGDWREFYMSIPAQPHHDADIVMSIAAERLAAAPATEPSGVERLAMEIADKWAAKRIMKRSATVGGFWWGSNESEKEKIAAQYLDLRGLLEHHPDHPELVRVKEQKP